MKHRLFGAALLASLAATTTLAPISTDGAAAQTNAPKSTTRSATGAVQTIEAPNGAVVVGNPAAKHTLVEYISYTCGHCADFAAESEAPIKSYVASKQIKVEYRSLLRDPFDFAAALLAHCGTPQQFTGNHVFLLKNQKIWMGKAKAATDAQKANWSTGEDYGVRLTHIAVDTGMVDLMSQRGFTAAQARTCLADAGKQEQLLVMTEDAATKGVEGTPTFFLDDRMLSSHNWANVKIDLDNATK